MTIMKAMSCHWALRTQAALVALLVSGTASKAAPTTDWSSGVGSCTVECGSGGSVYCAEGMHKLWESSQPNSTGASHWECLEGLCQDKHPPCDELAAPSLDSVSAALQSGDKTAIYLLIQQYPETLTLAAQSASFQVSDCSGKVVANLPYPSRIPKPAP